MINSGINTPKKHCRLILNAQVRNRYQEITADLFKPLIKREFLLGTYRRDNLNTPKLNRRTTAVQRLYTLISVSTIRLLLIERLGSRYQTSYQKRCTKFSICGKNNLFYLFWSQ